MFQKECIFASNQSTEKVRSSCIFWSGSTQEEVSQAVQVSIKEKMMSGTNRAVVWDGVTQSGQGLESQLKAITDSKHERSEAPNSKPMSQTMVGPSASNQGNSSQTRPTFAGTLLRRRTLVLPFCCPHFDISESRKVFTEKNCVVLLLDKRLSAGDLCMTPSDPH